MIIKNNLKVLGTENCWQTARLKRNSVIIPMYNVHE